jgi:hypothetical protein
MSRKDDIQLLHVAEVLRESSPGLAREIEIWQRLGEAGRARLAGPVARLADLLGERGRPRADVDPVLLELAVVDALETEGELAGKRLSAAWRRLERAAAALAFWNGLAPAPRREVAALAEPPFALPEGEQGAAGADTAGLVFFLERLAVALPHVPPRRVAALYRELAPEDGRELAAGAAELLAGHTALDRELAERMLLLLACLVPDALRGVHERLAALGVFHPGELFRGAGAEARDRFLARLPEAGEETPLLLSALAWIGDEVVRVRFREWSRTPPLWAVELPIPPEQHALDAAWYLEEDGVRRDLFKDECWALVPPGEAAESPGPVRVGTPHGADCPWCGRPLVTLFDLDLTAPRLAFVGLAGTRLRIATCPHCLPYAAPILTEVDGEGQADWSPANEEPSFMPEGVERIEALPAGALVLGERQRTALAARPFVHESGASQLGGLPAWLQEAEFPLCPECLRPMPFLAQLQLTDLKDRDDLGVPGDPADPVEGMFYAFLCAGCGRAATLFQQPGL